MTEEVMVEGYKTMQGPKKADGDRPCCLFTVQKLELISKHTGPHAVGDRPGGLLAQGCCWLWAFMCVQDEMGQVGMEKNLIWTNNTDTCCSGSMWGCALDLC